MIRNILLLCTGNICRSPMAEGILRELLPMHDVFSAGLSTMEGSPADPLAIELMWQSGIDISEHRSRNVASWMMREADLVFTMDSAQTQFVIRRYPLASKKVERLGQPCGLDIPDPYQHGLAAFCHSLCLIERAVQCRLPGLARNTTCLIH
ncbi:MAG: hypothetical protein RI928_229 [Pseudomonadota bacterium]